MAPKVPAKPAWWQAAAAFQPVRTPNFAERTVAPHYPVTNTRRASPPIWSAFERGLPVIVLVHIGLISAAG